MRLVFYVVVGITCGILLPARHVTADNRVLVIGIDGAGGSFLNNANTPTIDSLIANGAVRYNFLNEGALVPNPPSGYGASGVNWSTITTGASAAHHGVVDNSFARQPVRSVSAFLQVCQGPRSRQATPRRSSIGSQSTRLILANQYANLEQQFLARIRRCERRRSICSTVATRTRSSYTSTRSMRRATPIGWGSLQYNVATAKRRYAHRRTSSSALNARPGVVAGTENWLVIITADHGGQGTGHRRQPGPDQLGSAIRHQRQ